MSDLLTAADQFTFVPSAPTQEQISSPSSSGYPQSKWKPEPKAGDIKPKKVKEEQPSTPKCSACTEFTSKGSNAYVRKLTCKMCGHWTKTQIKKELVAEVDECDHKNFNSLGSTKDTKVCNCIDCGLKTRISRDEYEKVKKSQSEVLRMPVHHRQSCRRLPRTSRCEPRKLRWLSSCSRSKPSGMSNRVETMFD